MRRSTHTLRCLFTGMMVLLLGGCSGIQGRSGGEGEKGPSELMSEATEHFEKGNFAEATGAFQKLKDRYPYSKYAIIAELKMADAFYSQGAFEDAYAAYDEFEKLHPKNKDIPYVLYQKGMCKFRQLRAIDRDQTSTLKAKEEFERLIRRFPRDEYAQKARKNLRACLISLAEYELYVGHYYFRMGKYRTAMNRYMYLIQNYPDMGQYHEALEYLSRCKQELGKEAPPEE